MQILILLLISFLIWSVYKNRKYGFLCILLIISFGTLIDKVVPSLVKFAAIFLIFLIESSNLKKFRLNSTFFMFIIFFLSKEIITFLNSGSLKSFLMAVNYFCIIPCITYFSFLRIKNDKQILIRQIKLFIVISLIIQYYRAFFDITFFGYVTYDFDLEKYSSLMVLGSDSFRPSNLESCIIYSIVLSSLLSLVIYYEGINRKNSLILFLGFVGIVMTLSRSGLLIITCAVFYYLLKNRRIGLIIITGLLMVILFISMGFVDRIIEMFDFNSNTYNIRNNSISTVLNQISKFDLISLLYGKGMGSAYTGGENVTGESYYVENFFFYTLINNGILGLLAILYISVYSIIKSFKTQKELCLLICTILFTNCLACNLAAYTVEIVFLFICFSAGLLTIRRPQQNINRKKNIVNPNILYIDHIKG